MRERLSAAGLTLEEAIKIALTHKDTPTTRDAIPAHQLCSEFLASFDTRARKVAPHYTLKIRRLCEKWVSHYGKDRDIREIERGYEIEFAEWANSLGYAPDSVLHVFSSVRQMLNFAVKRKGYLTYNPLTHALRKDGLLPAPRANQDHILTTEQASALLALVETHYPEIAQNLAMQMFCGFREEQVERLRPEYFKPHLTAFDLPPGVIRKARDGSVGDYLDQLPENLVEWIKYSEAAIVRKPGRKSEETKEGKGAWPVIGRKVWARLMKRMAPFPEPYKIAEWPKNACRHTAATAAYTHFGLERTCAMLGWADIDMLKNQYAGKRWPAEPAKAYFEIAPGIAEKLCREHPELKGLITDTLFPRGGIKGWVKPAGWRKSKASKSAPVAG